LVFIRRYSRCASFYPISFLLLNGVRYCDHYPMLDYCSDVDGIKIERDKASGYSTYTPPAPGAEELEISSAEGFLPRYEARHFRRVGGSWLFAEVP